MTYICTDEADDDTAKGHLPVLLILHSCLGFFVFGRFKFIRRRVPAQVGLVVGDRNMFFSFLHCEVSNKDATYNDIYLSLRILRLRIGTLLIRRDLIPLSAPQDIRPVARFHLLCRIFCRESIFC